MSLQAAKLKSQPSLILENVTRCFGNNRGIFEADLELLPGTVLALIGANGSGKSTLFRCASFFEPIDRGRISITGCGKSGLSVDAGSENCSKEKLTAIRGRTLSIAFQHSQPWPHLSVFNNTKSPLLQLGVDNDEAEERAYRMLEELGLADRTNASPWQLSGGLRQRLVLARTLALETPLVMLDEITSALDPDWTERVRELLRRRASAGQSLLLISHQMGFVRRIADKVIFLNSGKILEQGSPEELFDNPRTERLRSFLANA